jgi:hypothetical protein
MQTFVPSNLLWFLVTVAAQLLSCRTKYHLAKRSTKLVAACLACGVWVGTIRAQAGVVWMTSTEHAPWVEQTSPTLSHDQADTPYDLVIRLGETGA